MYKQDKKVYQRKKERQSETDDMNRTEIFQEDESIVLILKWHDPYSMVQTKLNNPI